MRGLGTVRNDYVLKDFDARVSEEMGRRWGKGGLGSREDGAVVSSGEHGEQN